jgi:hypothetical protein
LTTEKTADHDYLAILTQNKQAIKTHCHLMTNYLLSGNRGSLKGVQLEILDGTVIPQTGTGSIEGLVDYDLVKRPPRRRNRKVSLYEKNLIQIYESVTYPRLLSRLSDEKTTGDVSVDISSCCDEDQSSTTPLLFLSSEADEEEQPVNLPDGDMSAPSARGQATRGEYLHGKKHPQIQWMTGRLLKMIRETKVSSVHLIDIGGGRGDLSVHLASALEKEESIDRYHITVLDLNEKSLTAGRDYAISRQLSSHISFLHLDFREFVLQHLSGDQSTHTPPSLVRTIDPLTRVLIVGLHICGDLTDLAIEYARFLSSSSPSSVCPSPSPSLSGFPSSCCGFLLVPCCYSKCCLNKNGIEDDLSLADEWRGWVQESQSLLLMAQERPSLAPAVDDLSLGELFPITPQRHITMRRSLCTLAESNPRDYQWRAMMIINALRLCYLTRTLSTNRQSGCMIVNPIVSASEDKRDWRLSLESFPRQFSLRNIVICGVREETEPDLSEKRKREER